MTHAGGDDGPDLWKVAFEQVAERRAAAVLGGLDLHCGLRERVVGVLPHGNGF